MRVLTHFTGNGTVYKFHSFLCTLNVELVLENRGNPNFEVHMNPLVMEEPTPPTHMSYALFYGKSNPPQNVLLCTSKVEPLRGNRQLPNFGMLSSTSLPVSYTHLTLPTIYSV